MVFDIRELELKTRKPHKVRVLATNKYQDKDGDERSYSRLGILFPSNMSRYEGMLMTIRASGGCILLEAVR